MPHRDLPVWLFVAGIVRDFVRKSAVFNALPDGKKEGFRGFLA
jgi:hypothetical protein